MSVFGNTVLREMDILNESKSVRDTFESLYVVLYSHMFKYQFQMEKQSGSWIESIIKCMDQINKKRIKNPADWNFVCKNYKLLIKRVLDSASQDTNLPKSYFPQEIPDEWDPISVLEFGFIKNFLFTYAYTTAAKNYLDDERFR